MKFWGFGGMWTSKTLIFIPVFTTILVNSSHIMDLRKETQYSSPEFPRQGNKNVTLLVYVKFKYITLFPTTNLESYQ